MGSSDQQFCLRWNNHQGTLVSVFDSLFTNQTLVDCTVAAEGQYLKAHKLVLSACSPYFEVLLSQHHEKHPIVILKDVKFLELKSMMDYMYRGEVNIAQDQLATFLKAAESLQIKGLSDNNDDAGDGNTTPSKSHNVPKPSTESKRPAPSLDSGASREGGASPSSHRNRRKIRRPSLGSDSDSQLDANACDLPGAQSTLRPISVPNSNLPTSAQSKPKQQELSSNPIAGHKKEHSEQLLEPKTEYLNNENSEEVEDLTLEDDDYEDTESFAAADGDLSNQGYAAWPMQGDQSGADEIFMAAQEAVAGTTQQDSSQAVSPEWNCEVVLKEVSDDSQEETSTSKYFIPPTEVDENNECRYLCAKCGRSYKHMFHLKAHRRECSKVPLFECPQCARKFYHSRNLTRHLVNVHKIAQGSPRTRRNASGAQETTTRVQPSSKMSPPESEGDPPT